MLYNPQRSNASITAGFLNTGHSNRATTMLNRAVERVTSLYSRIIARRRQAALHRETMAAMTKLNDRMLKDVGWPGRYQPARRSDPREH